MYVVGTVESGVWSLDPIWLMEPESVAGFPREHSVMDNWLGLTHGVGLLPGRACAGRKFNRPGSGSED